MKETEIFEAWADRLMEGTWALPDTPEKQSQLIELLSKDLLVGADATNATEQLYDLLGDDELFDQLYELAQRDANADARQVVLDRMQELSADPAVMKVITSLNIDADAAMDPPESTPADLDSEEDKVEEMLGGDKADALIMDVSIKEPEDGMEESAKDPTDQTEDPAGTKEKAYPEYQQDLMSILKHAGVPAKERAAPDYELEVDEGIVTKVAGELGKIGPDLLKAPIGFMQGAANELGKNVGSDVPDHDTSESKGLSNKDIAKKVVDDSGMAKALAGAGERLSTSIQPNMEGTDALKNIDWKEVGGSTAGGIGGWVAGNALGGPLAGLAGATVGGTVGGALSKDDQPKEGKLGAVAGGIAGGALTKSIKGAMTGAKLGSALQDRVSKNKEMDENANPGVTPADIDGVPTEELDEASRCNMSEAGESCPVHGLKECGMYEASALQGQYGHSGRMKPVAKDTGFLDRLKELSGMIRN